MSFSRLQKVVTYLLAVLGLGSLAFGGEIPLGAIALLGAGLVASWFAEGPRIHRPWWNRAFTAFTVVALAVQVARGFLVGRGWLGLAMEFSGLLLVSRLCNRRTAADYQQVFMLAFIQLVAATVLTTDLGYAGVFVAFVIVTPWVLTFAHLRREIERNYPAEADREGGADLARVLSSRRIVDLRFLSWTALLSVPMLGMTVALFALFPRIGLGMLSFGEGRAQHVSGFGKDIELGGFGVIRNDPTVVVRVVPSRQLSRNEQRRVLRLRGTAFDRYDGRKWTRSSSEPVKMSPIGEYYPLKRLQRDGDLTLRLILDRLDEPVLFVPTGAVGLRIAERGLPGGPRERVALARDHGFDIRYTSHEDMGIVYEAVVSSDRTEADIPVDRERDDARHLDLPPGHERIYALARELTRDLPDPYDKARRLEHYLRAEKHYAYSLDLPNVPAEKLPLEVFLFEAKRGHCEYFSSALALMLRAVGIPARNVSGFAGGEYNVYGGYYAVRQADAHSWVEALLPDRGWVPLDPTPAARDAFSPEALFREVRAMVDAMRAYWMTRVVGYDLRTQLRALRELRSFFQSFSFGGRDQAGERPDDARHERSIRDLGAAPVVLVLAVLGVVAAVVLYRRRKARRAVRALSASARATRRLYRELERTLAKAGRARPPHVTPDAHARALRESGFVAAEAVEVLTDAFVKSRYGVHELAPEQLEILQARLRDVQRAA